MPLKPQNIIQAAQMDLRRREHNMKVDDPEDGVGIMEPFSLMHQYAFHRSHVIAAESVKHLIRLAADNVGIIERKPLMDKVTGEQKISERTGKPRWKGGTIKKSTKHIYGDHALLLEALQLLEET